MPPLDRSQRRDSDAPIERSAGWVKKAQVNKGLCKDDVLAIGGCYSGRFGEEGDLLEEKNWILQLGEGCQGPSGA